MSASKALQFLDKRDLECAICLERFTEPKTLECRHSYCLHCLESLMQTHGKLRCPKCCQHHDLKKEDLKNLTSNKMISYLLEHVEKIESEKPTTCSSCDNQPKYNCSECQLYICGQCIKHHKIIPALEDHPLYTLDKNEEGESKEEQNICPTHCNNILEFYCSTCKKSACKKCEHVLCCLLNKHDVIPMKTAVDEFNQNATDVLKTAQDIKHKLKETLDSITKYNSDFESHLKLCRTAIEIQEKTLIKKVQEKSKALMSDIEEIYKEKKKDIDSEVKDLDSKLTQVANQMTSINAIMNKPEETETLGSHKTTVTAVRDKVRGTDFEKSFQKRNITPNFIPSTHLDELMNTEGIGKITTGLKVAKDDKGQPFVIKVSSLAESYACQLAATLIIIIAFYIAIMYTSGSPVNVKMETLGFVHTIDNISVYKDHRKANKATEVEYHGSGEYRITGRCNMEGDWQMKITDGVAHIKGSQVNVKVEILGLVHTIDNISNYKEHRKEAKVTDVVLDRDGCMLVSSYSKDILKFNQSGSFIARIQVPKDVQVNRMHQMGDGHMVYSDNLEKRVVMCDDNFQEIRSFGKGIMKYPKGLTVNKETRVLYVADDEAHCVFKFNIDDGRLLGTLGSEGSEGGQMKTPKDVTLTKEGYVIVADRHRIQMFDANERFSRILAEYGKEDGEVLGPRAAIMDMDENIIVSSFHKLQLFDKNGVFIKRIDHKDDGLEIPCGISVISNRPRRVAVANYNVNNVKIFNY